MAKARKASRRRKAATARRKARARGVGLDNKIKKALAELQKNFQVAKIVGSAKDCKLEIKTDCNDADVKFIALNAPFKTKALVSAP